jgi:hypothetical protein
MTKLLITIAMLITVAVVGWNTNPKTTKTVWGQDEAGSLETAVTQTILDTHKDETVTANDLLISTINTTGNWVCRR